MIRTVRIRIRNTAYLNDKRILLSMSSLRRIYPATARFDESLGRSSPAPTARVDSTDSATGYSSWTKELRLVYLFLMGADVDVPIVFYTPASLDIIQVYYQKNV